MTSKQSKTLRLVMPQWQGGDNPNTYLGSRLLAWLAPESDWPTVEVPVPAPDGAPARTENGVRHRGALMKQLQAAAALLETHRPDKVVVFGGDCLVDQAPFAYLNQRYDGKLGVLWLDAHPDVKTPKDYPNAHTMVLGNLLGEGDPEMAAQVKVPLDPARLLLAGLNSVRLTDQERDVVTRHNIAVVHTGELDPDSAPVLDWIRANDIRHLAIHLDLDVLDPGAFRSTFFGEPQPEADPVEAFPAGTMSFAVLARLLKDLDANTTIVGLGITEHLPWDAINLRNLLNDVPILQ
ncbi:arginase family protein [Shinella daejeonensis]|uniref:arginase family protein n=1 Tax=Shinella daejeonensis TaxID=659017 RepID=UPI0020C7BD21|nr:arginase family protein [Shinella daejeonensis]MCP8894602.1 arginase family protein [Shinella daejeonensis]